MQEGGETGEALQVLEFGGKTIAVMAKGGLMIGKGLVGGVRWSKKKWLQHRVKQHYASKGKHSALSMKNMDKLTGGNFLSMRIPLEAPKDEVLLAKFYQGMRDHKIAFSELPDLNLGDGCSEFAFDPMQRDKLMAFLKGYPFPDNKKAQEISEEDYYANATPEGMKAFTEDAIGNAKKEMQDPKKEKTPEEIHEAEENLKAWEGEVEDSINQINLAIDPNMIVVKTEEHCVVKVPNASVVFVFSMSDTFVNNQRQLFLSLPPNEKIKIYDHQGNFLKDITMQELVNNHANIPSKMKTLVEKEEYKKEFSKEEELKQKESTFKTSDKRSEKGAQQKESPKEQDISKESIDQTTGETSEKEVHKKETEKDPESIKFKDTANRKVITINETLIHSETDKAYFTRIPRNFNGPKEGEYIRINKSNTILTDGGKTCVTSLDMGKKYSIYDKNGNKKRETTGQQLYTHYDKNSRYLKKAAPQKSAPKKAAPRKMR